MGRTLDQLHACELAICRRFIAWRTDLGENLKIIVHNQTPEPPDFELAELLCGRMWLEVSDVFMDDEDVDYLLSPTWRTRGILENTDQKFIDRATAGLRKKLRKSSYAAAVDRLGKGVLILAARYRLIDANVLHDLQHALTAELVACVDASAFRVAYLEAQFDGAWHYFEIYPEVTLV